VSHRVSVDRSVALTEGATPAAIGAELANAVTSLENKVIDRDRVAIWDTLEIFTTSEEVEHISFSGTDRVEHRTITLSVLTISRSEASA